MPPSPKKNRIPQPEDFRPYMTVKECQRVAQFSGPEPIRRAVARGELPGVRPQINRLLIPTEAFFKWFHRNDVIPKVVGEVALDAEELIEKV